MKYESEFMRQIREEIAEEKRKSRFRNRCNYFERVHPLQHDADMLSEFCITRRISRLGALEALKRVARSMDTTALRFLVALVGDGSSYPAIRSCCVRVLAACDTWEAAMARLRELEARWRSGGPLSEAELQLLRDQQPTKKAS